MGKRQRTIDISKLNAKAKQKAKVKAAPKKA